MYNASSAFHTAVANGAHQIALLIFDDAVFTNDDIDVSRGIEFNDYFNTDEDLSIGLALSNEISFTLFNDSGLLDSYWFGNFTATIGALINTETYQTGWNVMAQSPLHTYTGYATFPYVRRDGTALNVQPSKSVSSILIYDGIVYCLAENTVTAYKDSDGTVASVTVNNFMISQMQKWEGKGICFAQYTSGANNLLKVMQGNTMRTYEFVPLGRFYAERPNVPSVIEIDFHCYDLMQRFERDMPDATALATKHSGFSYPCTFAELLQALCDYAEVPCGTTTFINSTAVLQKAPEDFSKATMRDVVGWIAEASASNARIDRDGRLILDWIHMTDQVMDENNYVEFNPYWYTTSEIEQLHNRASNGEYDFVRGMGGEAEGYLIQDNPLLKGVE